MSDTQKCQKWIWLGIVSKITKSKMIKLYKAFSDIDNIFKAQREDYEKLSFLKADDIEKLCNKDLSLAEDYISKFNKKGISIITRDMPYFPTSLFSISNFPSIIYCMGKVINLNNELCISVVGSRTPGSYGKNITYEITKNLAQNGFVVVSGMADGIDSIAHRAALDSNALTVAVLGCGVDIVYPKGNYELAKNIVSKGMIISEYPPGTLPEKYHFPERNKIIAALSLGTVVTEANIKSGSLITADWAKKYGKDVFAVPGNITSAMSGGTNELIRNGAVALTLASDVSLFYGKKTKMSEDTDIKPASPSYNATEKESLIIEALQTSEALSIDALSYKTGLSLSELSTELLFMEVKEIIKKTGADLYTLVLK